MARGCGGERGPGALSVDVRGKRRKVKEGGEDVEEMLCLGFTLQSFPDFLCHALRSYEPIS